MTHQTMFKNSTDMCSYIYIYYLNSDNIYASGVVPHEAPAARPILVGVLQRDPAETAVAHCCRVNIDCRVEVDGRHGDDKTIHMFATLLLPQKSQRPRRSVDYNSYNATLQ